MPLNPSDLGQWMADPEEWLNEEERESDQWEFEIRVRPVTLSPQLFSHKIGIGMQRASSRPIGESIPEVCHPFATCNI